jgi:hypothetical protein
MTVVRVGNGVNVTPRFSGTEGGERVPFPRQDPPAPSRPSGRAPTQPTSHIGGLVERIDIS